MNNSLNARSIFTLAKTTPGLPESRESCLPGRVMPRLISAAPGRSGALLTFLPCNGDSLRARAGWVWRAVAGLLLLLATLAPAQAQAQTAGICGRTAAVRNAILGEISGVSDCALVTDEHLAAIGQLNIPPGSTTALAAGDFDGLTALTELYISGNILTTLPAGVFDDLTSLTWLQVVGDLLTALPAGVFDNLTSLTQLELWDNDLTSLPAGVFDNNTALTELQLQENSLTTLPAVFDNLTLLTLLRLNDNGMTTLPAGVFDNLTSLTQLQLQGNQLETLSDDVFEELTALTDLYLFGNPGDPFAPVAMALPDDGTVPVAGGTVRLDGSGSDGGPWGTNVTYRWALTAPTSGVTVTFDDATSATPTVTIPALTAGAELTFTLTVTGRGDYYAAANDTATLTVEAAPVNASPSFTSPETFNVPENQTSVGTVAASDSDAGDSVTGYAIQGGADRSKFSLVASTGVLTFASAPNFEAPADTDTDNGYVVVVRAMSGTGARAKTADQTITVTVTDMAGEAPGVPVAPTVSSASVTSVTATWATPTNAGPAITDYDYRHQVKLPQGSWTEVTTTTITALSATITQLAEDTEYNVQVRATNGEGTSGWSGSGSGSTDANASPSFTSPAKFSAPENQTSVGTVAASDSDTGDSVTGYAIHGGADRSKFSIVASTGVLTFASAPNFEAPADAGGNDYVVVVRAMSGAGERVKTADQTILVTVTDVAGEAPGVPVAPTVSSASVTSVTATWTAPTNAGPAITDYDYRHQVKSPQGSWTEVTNTTTTALSATITQLAEDTEYNVQVRATNDEGTSGWSGSGSGSTDANASPSFTSPAKFSAPENQTSVGTVAASDDDSGDSVTGYAIHGGADRSKFSIVASTGVLTFASAPNFEAPADAGGNYYVVVVRAMSGAGERVKTADQTILVTVTDVAGEAPGVPVAPSVSSASVTSVTATWTAPANAGPPITDYDYRHQVTSPRGSWTEVTTTTITALSATITGLAEDTEYNVQVRATNDEGTSGWSGSGSGSTDANASPSFTSPATFNVPENQTAVGTAQASDSDTGDSVTGYAIHGGADASKFSIAPASGVLTFASAPNFEAPADADTGNDYMVVVRAMSGTGARVKTADQTITVTVTDVAGEAPGVPAAPTVSSASVTSVTATWAAPTNAGPAITDYDYRHQVKLPQGSWTEVTNTTITALSATITQLAEDTEYNVQVRATNGEGTSGWSGSGSGSTDANASPSFTSPATFSAPENQTAVGTVHASDSDPGDSVTGYAIHGGADRSKFSIAGATGALTFASAPNFEAPADADTGNDYVVVVRAMSGAGARAKTADQTITVTVTDVGGEAPGVPVAPSVSSASATSLNVSWTAPANAGPPITDYDYRYGVALSGPWTEVTNTTITALEATIAPLAEDTEYYVQVRARNADGASDWSAPGSGSTDANAAPSFDSPARFNARENQTAVGTVAASDSDTGDSVTGYAIQGGADGSKFSIDAATGVLTFASAPNFEAASDADTGNDYVVVVRATSGAGAREKTAEQTITVAVTDVGGEAPGVPVAPVVSSASVTSVTVAWTAPTNAGPPITDYDYRHQVTSPRGSWTEVTTTTITALSATITGLVEDTEYDVQVRATNGEGTSGWSDPGTGTPTGATEAGAIANAPENLQATAGDAEATLRWDAPNNDSGADITGYAYRYKASGGDFIAYTDIPESGPGEANARSYTVPGLTNGVEYVFHVRALNEHGGGLPAEVTVMLPGIVSSESEELPTEVVLWGNYPNPFNPETTIRYALPQAGQVHLAVYDLLGHEVAILVDRSKPAGNHTVRFGADNLPSGLYVYRLQAGGEAIVRTMILVK